VLAEVDIFVLYRWSLAVAATIYTLLWMFHTASRTRLYFRSSRRATVLGHYTLLLMLRVRLRRMMGDLIQIVILLAILAYVVYLHWNMEA
jgi:hypothetical protein